MVHEGQPAESHARRHRRTLAGALWFPTLFFFGFLACYLLPFHSPAPHHVEVAVSPPAAARSLSRTFAAKAPGSFDLVAAPDAAAVRRMVIDRQVVAGYSATGTGGDLYVAQAGGAELAQVVSAAFSPVAAHSGHELRTVDLVPAARGDQTGTGLFYLSLPWALVPYIVVMMLGRASLTQRGKLLTLAGSGVFISVVGYYAGLAIAVVPNRPLAMLYAFLTTQAVAWTTYGLVPFARRLLPGVGVLLFVLLSIPSSGGAIPAQLMPGFFRFLNPVMPLGNLIDALRAVLYFHDRGLLRPTLVLCAWLAAGALLATASAWRRRRWRPGSCGVATPDPAAEDPTIQHSHPHAVRPGEQEPFGATLPMLGGRACRADGTPVSDAHVVVLDAQGNQLVRTRTDGDGRYAAAGLPEAPLTVVLLPPGHAPGAAHVVTRPGHPVRQDFTLDPRPVTSPAPYERG
jgi:Carboxypeptidase regulatory-like domain